MRFELSLDQQVRVALADRLARERFAPRAAAHDAASSFPVENFADLHRHGFDALNVPSEHGGLGVDPVTYALVLNRLARGCGSTALMLGQHSAVVGFLAAFASPEQQRRYFHEVVEDGALFASLASEPASSEDGPLSVDTVARRVAGGYVVNGVKHFCSLGPVATYYFVTCALGCEPEPSKALMTVVVRRDAPGVRILPTWNAMAMRATVSDSVELVDCLVPDDDVVIRPGQAPDFARRSVPYSYTLGNIATYLGVAEAAYEFAVEYARTRINKPETVPISHVPHVRRHLAEMNVALEAAGLMLQRAASAMDGSDEGTRALALHQAKYLIGETVLRVTDTALKVCGGRGILKAFPLERFIRDVRPAAVMPPNGDRCLETIAQLVCDRAAVA